MSSGSAQNVVTELLALAGATINGDRPWDLRVHNEGLYDRLLREGSLGLGESYMDGWWDCDQLDDLFHRLFWNRVDESVTTDWRTLTVGLKSRLFNLQTPFRARHNGSLPYSFGDDLFESMLDAQMVYSCAYWKRASTLDEAQEAKLDLVCRKLGLAPGQRVLDIGCGWGSFARYAAERYGVSVVGINLSLEQTRIARERCKPFPIEIRVQDYRSLEGRCEFDHVVSIGMFEHVGYKNYRQFMKIALSCLKPGGLFLLHTIGRNRSMTGADPWIQRYVFPNAMLPSARQVATAVEGLFVIEDWHNFSTDYDRTLMSWRARFEQNWHNLKGPRYDERFRRMWNYYLLASAARFRARRNQLWQIVLSERGVLGGYVAHR
ncbi:MAG TPA: cyclopropane fatty acyl phospholipid synthase [Vicinamibacterales bacterium]